MPARLAGSTETTAVLGGTRVMKVRQWQCYSEPSDTYFEIRARAVTTRDQVQVLADAVSATIEQLLSGPAITDINWAQDVTAGGQLIGVFTVYYHDLDSDTSGFVELPYSRFTPGDVGLAIIADLASTGVQINL